MSFLQRFVLTVGIAAGVASPALAATITVPVTATFDTTKTVASSTIPSGSGTTEFYYGNTRSFATGSGAAALNMTVSAWSAALGTGTTYNIEQSYLGQWAGYGLGVINTVEGYGDGNQHQIDNYGTSGRVDFLLLEFDCPVTLSTIGRNSYAMSGNGYALDNDAAVSALMPTMSTVTAKTTITTTQTNTYAKSTSTTPKTVGTPKDTRGTTTTTTAVSTEQPKTTAELQKVNQTPTVNTSAAVVKSDPKTGTTRTKVTEKVETATSYKATIDSTQFTEVKSCLATTTTSCKTTTATTTDSKTAAAASGVSAPITLNSSSGPASSKTWLVSAAFAGDKAPDGFKLANLTVNYSYEKFVPPPPSTGAVPEPATWAMMILGFGVVGATLRRQTRRAAKAA